jgi:hypothetical protein
MEARPGTALAVLHDALDAMDMGLAGAPALHRAVFRDADPWRDLLTHKLVPQFEGGGCLIVAVTGGTNTGKSTVFNLLAGSAVSPASATAAATRRLVAAASPARAAQLLGGRLLPEFRPEQLTSADQPVSPESSPDTIFVSAQPGLPDSLVLLDTPDVDSLEREHWDTAEHIRAAGDVLVAVVTAEKYRDERVVSFFREALASGRVVVAVMNKADPAGGFAVARGQLDQFLRDTGGVEPCFVTAHDFALADRLDGEIRQPGDGPPLPEWLRGLDVPAVKERVYRDTLAAFAERASAFLDGAAEEHRRLLARRDDLHARLLETAVRHDPAPGPEVGGLCHEYVQARRGPVPRWIGLAGKTLAKGVRGAIRTVSGAVKDRAALELREVPARDIDTAHRGEVERLARDYASILSGAANEAGGPAGELLRQGLEGLDLERAVTAAADETMGSEGISEGFRRHAWATMDRWWNENPRTRKALLALDALFAVTPAAVSVPLYFLTGGWGVPETVAVAGSVVEPFVARIIEYQFADAWWDFLSPWKRERQDALAAALARHLLEPATAPIMRHADVLAPEQIEPMRQALLACAPPDGDAAP